MADKTTVSSTNSLVEGIINAATISEFCRKGDFYKLIKTIKKNNYSQKDKFTLMIGKAGNETKEKVKKDYNNVINLISDYYETNKQYIDDVTSIKNVPVNSIFSLYQIGAMADKFNICFGPGMVYSENEDIVFCISKNTYRGNGEGWNYQENIFKYHCKTDEKTGKIVNVNYIVVDKKKNIAMFVKENNQNKYKFIGLFKADKIEDIDKQPYLNLKPHNFNPYEVCEDETAYTSYTQEHPIEGRLIKYNGIRFERNPQAREECIKFFGPRCQVCGFDFEAVYGHKAKGYCHVHHIVPISKIKKEYRVNHKVDLAPVCPNCHVMLHKFDCTIAELKKIISGKH